MVREEVEKLRCEWKPLNSKFRTILTPPEDLPWRRILNLALLRDMPLTAGGFRQSRFSGWNRACSGKLLEQILPTNFKMILGLREIGLSLNSAVDRLDSFWIGKSLAFWVSMSLSVKVKNFNSIIFRVLSDFDILWSFTTEGFPSGL